MRRSRQHTRAKSRSAVLLKPWTARPLDHWRALTRPLDVLSARRVMGKTAAALGRQDIARLAPARAITPEQFEQKHLDKTDEPDRFLIRQKPCPFLAGRLCRLCSVRPESCVEFPFLHKGDFTARSTMVLWNLPHCPIVYNVCELLKAEVAELERRLVEGRPTRCTNPNMVAPGRTAHHLTCRVISFARLHLDGGMLLAMSRPDDDSQRDSDRNGRNRAPAR